MTVNGTGMADVREVVFPGGVSVSNIEHVGNGMIRLTAPAGIASTGGKLVVRPRGVAVFGERERMQAYLRASVCEVCINVA